MAENDLTGKPATSAPDILASQQLFQARMKSNDVLQEHLKQIITVASATLVLTVTFVKDIVSPKGAVATASWLLPASWCSLSISVFVAIFTIALLVNNLDGPDKTVGKKYPRAFAAGSALVTRVFTISSLSTFGVGIISLGLFGALNYQLFLLKDAKEYKLLSESQAVDQIKAQLPSDLSLINIKSIELVNNPDSISESLLAWHVKLAAKQQDGSAAQGFTVITMDYYVDSFTGKVRQSPEVKKPDENPKKAISKAPVKHSAGKRRVSRKRPVSQQRKQKKGEAKE